MLLTILRSIEQGEGATFRLRFLAMATHFVGTMFVALLTYTLIRQLWYPNIFWKIAGGSELFLLICCVDAVLGPVLTFAIFNPAKGSKRLRFDLIVIAVLQLVALGYGISTTASVRPLFLAYTVDRFDLVTAIDVNQSDLRQAEVVEFRSISWLHPRIIGTRSPKDSAEKIELIDSALAGRDRHLLPKTYVPFEQVRHECVAKGQSLTKLTSTPGIGADLVKKSEFQLAPDHPKLGFVPVIAKGEWVMIVDATTCDLLDVVPVSGF